MIENNFASDMGASSAKMVRIIRRLSLDLVHRQWWRRESADIGMRYLLRPRLCGDYSKEKLDWENFFGKGV